MNIPENIGLNNIQPSIFSLLYEFFPHLHTQIKQRKHTNNTFQKRKKKKKKDQFQEKVIEEAQGTSGVLLG